MDTMLNSHAPATHQFDIEGGGFDPNEGGRHLPFWVGPLMTVLAVVLVVLGFMLRGTLQIQAADGCYPASAELSLVQRLVLAGDAEEAATLAHTTLAHSHLCDGANHTLALTYYRLAMDNLLTKVHVPGDVVGENAVIRKWQAITAFGHKHVPLGELRSPSEVEELSYSLGYYSLARIVWFSTWESRSPGSTPSVNHYYSVLVNLGRELVRQSPAQYRAQGLSFLSLAYRIAMRWHLMRGEADQDLRRFVGVTPSSWPAAASDPLLRKQVEKKPR